MQGSSDSLEPVDLLADEFLESQRRGEKPTIEAFCDRHPELADEIREVFPALLIMEEVAPATGDLSVSNGSSATIGRLPMTQVGDYRILKEIGRGGMGVVYEAEQESLGRRVALKVLPRQAAGDENSVKRFQQEARAAARMHHTNIVPVFEVGEADDFVFYAMQLIHGQGLDLVVNDLRQLRSERIDGERSRELAPAQSLAASLVAGQFEKECLVERGVNPDGPSRNVIGNTETIALNHGSTSTARLPGQSEISSAENNRLAYFRSVAEVGLQAAQALSYAHARGIIHRDIKPSNLLLDTTGVVWITDFGLAKTDNSAMTQTGDILGTIRYMSPERFNGQCDVRTDVYALGLTLYEMLVLKPAFESPDRLKLMSMVLKEEAAPPRSIDPRIPRDLETIVLKASDKDPRRRYQSADDMADDLQRFVNDEPVRARRISLLERCSRWSRHNKAIAGSMAFIATLITAVAIGSSLMAHRLSEEKRRADNAAIEALAEAQRADTIATEKATLADQRKTALDEAIRLKKVADAALQNSARQTDLTLRNLYAAEMKMSRYAHMAGEIDRSKELLANWVSNRDGKDLRGWEWYLQSDAISVPTKEVPLLGDDLVTDVSWSPDGKRLVASRFIGTIQIRDIDGKGEVQELKPKFPWATTVDWSPTRNLVAAGGVNGNIRVWDASTGEVVYQFKAPSALISSVRWSHDGKLLGVTGNDYSEIIDIDSDSHFILEHESADNSDDSTTYHEIVWSGDDRHVATRSGDRFRVFDVKSGDLIAVQDSEVEDPDAISWHPTKDWLAVVDEEGTTRIWSLKEEAFIKEFPGDYADSYRVEWHPLSDRLAVLRRNERIEVFDTDRGEIEYQLPVEKHSNLYLSWHPSGEYIAGPTPRNGIRVWGPLESDTTEITAATNQIITTAWHPEGVNLATGGDSETVEIWDPRDKKRLLSLRDPKGELVSVQSIVFNETGDLVAVAGRLKDDVLIWNTKTGKLVRRLVGPPYENFESGNGIRVLDWCSTTNRIAAGNSARRVYVWDVSTGELESTIHLENGSTRAVRFLPQTNGEHLLVSDGKNVALWKTDGSSKDAQITTPNWALDVAVDLGGTRVAVGYGRQQTDATGLSAWGGAMLCNVIRHGDLIEFANEVTLEGSTQAIRSIDFTTDGRRLLGAGGQGTVFVWDATRDRLDTSRREILTLETGIERLHSIRASSDGAMVVAAGESAVPMIWNPITAFATDLSPSLLPAIEKRELAGNATTAELMVKARILTRNASWSAAVPTIDQLLIQQQSKWFLGDLWVFDQPMDVTIDEETEMESLASINEFDPTETVSSEDLSGVSGRWLPMALQREIPIDLGELFDAKEQISGYALLPVYTKEEQELGIVLGADDHSRVWLNGELVFDDRSNTGPVWNKHGIPVRLKPGWNTVLLKTYNDTGRHGFFLTLMDTPRDLGRIYAASGHLEEALEMYNISCERFPQVTFPHIMRGRVLWKLGRREEAERVWEYARNLQDGQEFAFPYMSWTFWQLRQSDRSIKEQSRIVDHKKGNAKPLHHRAHLLSRAGRFQEASHDFDQALKLNPMQDLWAMQSLVVLAVRGETEQYIATREDLIDRFDETEDPKVAERIVKGSLLAEVDQELLDRLEKLDDVIRRADPQHTFQRYFYITRGLFRFRKGTVLLSRDVEAAAKEFEIALQRLNRAKSRGLSETFDITVDSLAAMALHHLGRTEQAKVVFASASEEVRAGVFPEPGEILGERWYDQLIAKRLFEQAGRLIYGTGHDALLEGQRLMSQCRPDQALPAFLSALELSDNARLIRSQVVEAFGTGIVGATSVIQPSKLRYQKWEYCSTEPAEGWQTQAGTDDENWIIRNGPFASNPMDDTPVFPWSTKDQLWIRKAFQIDDLKDMKAILRVRIAGNAEVWINGVLAALLNDGWNQSVPINDAGSSALREGRNVIAIHATGQPQKFRALDLGLFLQPNQSKKVLLVAINNNISDSDKDALERSQIAAQLGNWHEAALAMEKHITTVQNDASLHWMRAGLLHAIANQQGRSSIEGYQRLCGKMIDLYHDSENVGLVERTLKTCLLLDVPMDTSALPIPRIVSAAGKEKKGLRAWFNFALALTALREGNSDEALRRSALALENSEGIQYVGQRECLEAAVHAVVSLSEYGRGDLRAAKRAFAEGERRFRDRISNQPDGSINPHDSVNFSGKIDHDGLIARMLLNEAQEKLNSAGAASLSSLSQSDESVTAKIPDELSKQIVQSQSNE